MNSTVRVVGVGGVFLLALAAQASAQQNVVAQAKADLAAAGVQVERVACSDFEIVKLVAGRLRDQGAGLLQKDCCGDELDPNRSHCSFNGVWYAHDIVAFPDGRLVDVAIDGGGANGPSWGVEVDPSAMGRYRSAAALGLTGFVLGVTPPPVLVPPPTPTCPPGLVFMEGATLHGCFPAPTSPPPPIVLPSNAELVALVQRILEQQAQALAVAKDTNEHVVSMDRTVSQTLGFVGKFLAKYVAPAIGGYIVAKQLQSPPAAPAVN